LTWLTAVDVVPGTGSIVQAIHVGGAASTMRLYRVKLLTSADLVPAAAFIGTPTGGLAPLTVAFTDLSTGLITNRLWNFGDGTVSNTTALLLNHTYTAPGTNTVTLTVFGPPGSHAFTRTNYVVVRGSIRITSLRFSGTNVIASFETAPGRNYRLESNDPLSPGAWAIAVDNIPGTGGIVEVQDPRPQAVRRFYRILQLP
jgi:PKD repeat protein